MDGKRIHQWLLIALLAGLALGVTACAPKADVAPEPQLAATAGSAERADAGPVGAIEEPAVVGGEAEMPAAPAAEDFAAVPEARVDSEDAPAEGAVPMPPAGTNPAVIPPDQQFRGPLQAGVIDDNAHFGEYLQYRIDYHKFLDYPVQEVDISERHTIRVTTPDGLPVLGAEVLVYDGQQLVTALRTPATGQVYFFPLAFGRAPASFDVVVQKGQASQRFTLTRESRDAAWPVTLTASPARPPVKLDVLFLVDATGSMGDEIDQLKDNILSISAQIEALPSRPDVRFGLVHYRDRGDEYVVRSADFTGNVQAFQRDLRQVYAAGGGDDPESLNEALHVAISQMSWRVDDTVSLVFLVADAPPHLDYPQDYRYADEMMIAAEFGIKIFPIGSRLDGANAYQQQAEYIFRQLAHATGGKFIFLTYEDTPQSSGEPGTEYSIPGDRYTVEDLDALVVRLVTEELDALSTRQQ